MNHSSHTLRAGTEMHGMGTPLSKARRDPQDRAPDLEEDSDPALSAFALHAGHREITKKEFQLFQELIYREAGICLAPVKTALLVGRLAKRLRIHGLKSFEEYYRLAVESPEERVHMLDAISTNETHFFREPRHFDLLQSTILPQWIAETNAGRPRRIRVWSAGCSSGQEPYSLAMILLHHFPPNTGWEIEIVASDLSTRMLEIAKSGVWPAEKARDIPCEYLKAFMLRGVREHSDKVKAGPQIRSIVRFLRLNLKDSFYPFTDKFDLIFCRNVLIYFDLPGREEILRHLIRYLRPGGYFFLGHAEGMPGSVPLRTVVPTVYQLGESSGASAGKSSGEKNDRQ